MNPEIPGYDVIAPLGEGGNAVVYRATQTSVGADVALKVLRDSLTDRDRRRAAVERRALGAMRGHPHIVTVHDAGVTEAGRDWIAMELLEGGSLADVITARGPLPHVELHEIGQTIASALEAAHDVGMVHRDVKPANIMFDRGGRAKLADFGIAREGAAATTTAGSSMTVAYAPPEVIGGESFTSAGDVYSLTVVLFEAALGRQPFVRDTDASLAAVIHRIAMRDVPDLDELDLPVDLAAVIHEGMAVEPASRPTAAQVRVRLEGDGDRAPRATPAAGPPPRDPDPRDSDPDPRPDADRQPDADPLPQERDESRPMPRAVAAGGPPDISNTVVQPGPPAQGHGEPATSVPHPHARKPSTPSSPRGRTRAGVGTGRARLALAGAALVIAAIVGGMMLRPADPITVAVGLDDAALRDAVTRVLEREVDGLDVTGVGGRLARMVAEGTVDVAVIGTEPFLRMLEDDEDVRAIGGLIFPGQPEPGDRMVAVSLAEGPSSMDDPAIRTVCATRFGFTRYVGLYVEDALEQTAAPPEVDWTSDLESALDSLRGQTCDLAFIDRQAYGLLQAAEPGLREEFQEVWTSTLIPNDPLVISADVSDADRARLDELVVDSRLFSELGYGVEASDDTPYLELLAICRRLSGEGCAGL